MLESYVPIALMIAFVTLVACSMVFMSWLFGPKRMGGDKAYPYECGMRLLDKAHKKFSVKFYLVAALFIIFDLEIAFIYPWALSFRNMVSTAMFLEMLVFMGILFAGFVYVWRRGVFDWK